MRLWVVCCLGGGFVRGVVGSFMGGGGREEGVREGEREKWGGRTLSSRSFFRRSKCWR